MATGIDLIAAERQRQIEQEGFDAARDDAYTNDELVRAALCYAASAAGLDVSEVGYNSMGRWLDDPWPESWDKVWDKRKIHSRKRQLEIAGALIAAELDRLALSDLRSKETTSD